MCSSSSQHSSSRSRIVRQNMTLPSERTNIREELGQIEDIAVDWTTGNVYFTMHLEFDSFIGVVNKDGKFLVTLVTTGIGKPRGIALHPLEK